jgi:hypothetical protein
MLSVSYVKADYENKIDLDSKNCNGFSSLFFQDSSTSKNPESKKIVIDGRYELNTFDQESISPIRDLNSNKECVPKTQIGIPLVDREIFYVNGTKYAIIPTVSGSTYTFQIVDLKSCKTHWSITRYGGGMKIEGSQLTFSSGCFDCPSVPKSGCQCKSALVYKLNSKCQLLLDKKKSIESTRGNGYFGDYTLFQDGRSEPLKKFDYDH